MEYCKIFIIDVKGDKDENKNNRNQKGIVQNDFIDSQVVGEGI